MESGDPANLPRILIIDDNPTIHEDMRKILCPATSAAESAELAEDEDILFGEHQVEPSDPPHPFFNVDSAFQGEEGLALVQKAIAEGAPYRLAFVDVRMPPGCDGIETTARLWEVSPDLQVVICTAYSDYSCEEMIAKLGKSDRLVILKKPFENIEVRQLANALTLKSRLNQETRAKMAVLESTIGGSADQRRQGESEKR